MSLDNFISERYRVQKFVIAFKVSLFYIPYAYSTPDRELGNFGQARWVVAHITSYESNVHVSPK